MKKFLVSLFAAFLIFLGGTSCYAAESTGFFTTLKNVIIKDVQNTVSSTVTVAANKALDVVKLNQSKQQLNDKKQELADLESSSTNFLVKIFKRRKLNNEIKNLEIQIKELENGLSQ